MENSRCHNENRTRTCHDDDDDDDDEDTCFPYLLAYYIILRDWKSVQIDIFYQLIYWRTYKKLSKDEGQLISYTGVHSMLYLFI